MAGSQRPTHVPRFGNWDPNDHAPYTKVFDTARAGRGGRLINPNDPAQNPDAFKPPPAPPSRKPENEPAGAAPARRGRSDRNSNNSRDDGEYKKYMESPARKPARTASSNRSPLHPSAGNKGGNSPALPKFGDWDPKDPSSGEGFTAIFNNARIEKQDGGPVRAPPGNNTATGQHQSYHRNLNSSNKRSKSWFCCLS